MNHFSLSRTGQLIKKQWTENRRFYLMSVLALSGMLAIAFVIWISMGGRHYREDTAYGFGFTGLFITGAIFASISFNMLNAKDTGIYWISFPASHFEKLLAVLFFNVIAFTIVYFLCFWVLKAGASAYIKTLVDAKPYEYSFNRVDWNHKSGFVEAFPNFICGFFAVQAAFLLGAASFKRFSFILTIIIASAAIFLTMFYLIKLSKGLLPAGYHFQVDRVTTNERDGLYKQYDINLFLKNFTEIFLKYLLAPFLWLVTWFKLKEKEI